MGAADSRSLRSNNYVLMIEFAHRSTYVPFRCFLDDVRREFMRHLPLTVHGTLDPKLQKALHEGNTHVVAYPLAPRA
jgi:hypothetical protein